MMMRKDNVEIALMAYTKTEKLILVFFSGEKNLTTGKTAVERAGGGSVGINSNEKRGRKNSINDILSIHKDRSLCTPQELEQIRRERIRIHARRTRERKKKMLILTQSQVKKLEQDNKRLLRKVALTLPSELVSCLKIDMGKVRP